MEAYVGCVSGASLRDEYLEDIKRAGFADVNILSEKAFPVDSIINDPTAKTVIEELDITREEVEDVMGSVVSIHAQAIKPEKGLLVS